VSAFIDEMSHVVIHELPTQMKNGFFVFGETAHMAEDIRINSSATSW
jgi:hypothetical protein